MPKQNELSENLNHWDYIDRYSAWMYHTYEKYVGKKVFDVGAGMGRMAAFYVANCDIAVATDIFQSQVDYMNERFKSIKAFRAVKMDIMTDDIEKYCGQFDTVLCINVLEHLEDDQLAVSKMKRLLSGNGRLIIMVPAWQKLYCALDKNVNHYRRYDPGMLLELAEKNNLKVIKNIYFNRFGIIPYWLKGKKKSGTNESFSSSLNEKNSKIYNIASSVLDPLERRVPPKKGLSELIIMERGTEN